MLFNLSHLAIVVVGLVVFVYVVDAVYSHLAIVVVCLVVVVYVVDGLLLLGEDPLPLLALHTPHPPLLPSHRLPLYKKFKMSLLALNNPKICTAYTTALCLPVKT